MKTKATPVQNIQFQCYLIQEAGYAEIADLGRKAVRQENWKFLYKMADDLERPKGKLNTNSSSLVDQDIIHNIRLSLNSIILEEMPNEPQPETPPENVSEPSKEKDDDNLQPA